MIRPRWRLAAALAAAALAGCGRGRRAFPIGLYEVSSTSALPLLRKTGFTAVQSANPGPAFIAALRREGLSLLAGPDLSRPAPAWPMAAWYLYDEPDARGLKPEDLVALDRRVRAWSPGTPTAFVLGDGRAAARYAGAANVLMVDWYPVPHRPLESLGDQVRLLVAAAADRPVWAVVQAMDWGDYPQGDARKPRIGRFPNRDEIRFMSYDALAQGARGLWYYSYMRPGRGPLPDSPGEWSALASVVRELAALRPILEGGNPAALPFLPEPEGVAARGWRYHGRDYVVVLNRRRDAELPAPRELLDGSWRPLFESRRDLKELLEPRDGGWYLPPYRVLVLEGRLRPFGP